MASWNRYYDGLKSLEERGLIQLPTIPNTCVQNAHMFYVKVDDLETRTSLLEHLNQNNILAVFHYIPLHSSLAGLKFGRFDCDDIYTTFESERLIRLPMYFRLTKENVKLICEVIREYFKN